MVFALSPPELIDLPRYADWSRPVTPAIDVDACNALSAPESNAGAMPKTLSCGPLAAMFEASKGGKYGVIGSFPKCARGLPVRDAFVDHIDGRDSLRGFGYDGYCVAAKVSDKMAGVFGRRRRASS